MSEEVDSRVTRRYNFSQKLGKGAYGIVWKVTDRKTQEELAVKKVFDAFQNSTDAQRTYREVVYLKQMHHENIVRLYNVICAENDRDIYLVFEYMETDLHATIRANILEDIHKQYIIYQAFKALYYMHSARLVHRDMKPANLLLNSECLMKLADFGLARSLKQPPAWIQDSGATAPNAAAAEPDDGPDERDTMTDYVATRWYRPPEILVGSRTYTYQADLWSLGCIFGEMLNGKPPFSGISTLNQLEVVRLLLGPPTPEDIESFDSEFSQSLIDNMQELEPEVREKLKSSTLEERFRDYFPSATDDALKLLMDLLQYNPAKRILPRAGMTHAYCKQFHDQEAEVEMVEPVGLQPSDAIYNFLASNHDLGAVRMSDNDKKNTSVYRELLYGIGKALSDKESRR